MIHDCIYQFLRLFYHSRFKPQQLEMTLTQLSAPVLDLVLVLPLILRLYKDFLRFSNTRKLKIQSKSEVNRLWSLNFNEFKLLRLFPRISELSFCYTLISICHQYHLLRGEYDLLFFIKQRHIERLLLPKWKAGMQIAIDYLFNIICLIWFI